MLNDPSAIDGALVIDGARVGDTLSPLIQRLCFEAVLALVHGTTFTHAYFSDTGQIELRATDGVIKWHGDYVPEMEHPRLELLNALYACGLRYLSLVEHLGHDVDLAHLRPFAEQAGEALEGLATERE